MNAYAFGTSIAGSISDLKTLRANLDGEAMTILGKYQIDQYISIFGGIKLQTISGSSDVSIPLSAAAGSTINGNTTLSKDSALNFFIGSAYEITSIAFRITASYETPAQFDPNILMINSNNFNTGPGEVNTPSVFLLEIQSGIAQIHCCLVRFVTQNGASLKFTCLPHSSMLNYQTLITVQRILSALGESLIKEFLVQ